LQKEILLVLPQILDKEE